MVPTNHWHPVSLHPITTPYDDCIAGITSISSNTNCPKIGRELSLHSSWESNPATIKIKYHVAYNMLPIAFLAVFICSPNYSIDNSDGTIYENKTYTSKKIEVRENLITQSLTVSIDRFE